MGRPAMRTLKVVVLTVVCLIVASAVQAQTAHVSAAEAKNHVGATVTVCGKVASTRFVSGSKGQPTFLNLDKPHPKEIFTIVIWGTDRPKFGKPKDTYRNKDICVTGRITSHKSVPQVIIGAPSQIQTQK
jgi:hypothetical protein